MRTDAAITADFRVVNSATWSFFHSKYGGGPVLSVVAPRDVDLQARPAKRVAAVYLVCHTASIWHVCASCPLCERLRGTREEAVESMMRVHYNSILTVQLVLQCLDGIFVILHIHFG